MQNDISLKSNSSGNELIGLTNPPNQLIEAESPTKMNQPNEFNDFKISKKPDPQKFKKDKK